MTTHIQHPHTAQIRNDFEFEAAAIAASDAAHQMEALLLAVRDLNRTVLQLGTHDDVVPDDRDRQALLTLTGLIGERLDELENWRREICNGCHGAKYPEKVAA